MTRYQDIDLTVRGHFVARVNARPVFTQPSYWEASHEVCPVVQRLFQAQNGGELRPSRPEPKEWR